MSDTPTAPLEAAQQPDPDRAVSARLDPAGVSNILRLLRALFAYGKNLVETLRENDYPETLPWYAFLACIFGTTDPAEITLIVVRGLLRIAALQARLSQTFARRLLPLPLRDDRAAMRIDGGRGPGQVTGWAARPRRPRATDWVIPPGWPAGVTSLDREPSPEEQTFADIVAQDENRPFGAILLDICLDLGIVSALTHPAAWDELLRNLALYGGDPAPLIDRSQDVQNAADPASLAAVGEEHAAVGPPAYTSLGDPILTSPPWLAAFAQSPLPPCTGPP